MSAAPAPRWWLPTLVVGAAVALATIASLYGLRTVVDPGDWWGDGVRVIVLLAVVTTGVRLIQARSRLMADDTYGPPASLAPSAAGLVVGAWAILAAYGSPGDRFDPLVGTAALDRVSGRLAVSVDVIRGEVAPVEPTLPIVMLVVIGAGLVFLTADLIAGGLHYPVVSGAAMLLLWAPSLIVAHDVPDVTVVGTVLALAAAISADTARRARRPRRPLPVRDRTAAAGVRVLATIGGATAAVVAALAIGAASAGLPAVADTSWSTMFGSSTGTVRLSADLDMRRNLNERSGEVALRYDADDPVNGPLRVFTLTGFDGTTWHQRSEQDGDPIKDPTAVLWPDGDVVTSDETVTLRLTVGTLHDRRLPIPLEPRSVDADGDWSYDPVHDEVTGDAPTTEGDTYTVTIHPRDLDADTLRDETGPDPDDPNYLEFPASTHADDIRALAEEITAGETTRYDQALALQTYFRDTSRFTYDPTIPRADTDDAVWDFLQQRTGYCVQYSTAMTMMARSLGIPARLGVGFLPGTETADGKYQVTGRDSHAWPELYFPGSGWVRFEPTPAQQTGAAPPYAVPVSADPRGQGDEGNLQVPEPSGQAAPTASASVTSGDGAPGTDGSEGRSAWVPAAVGATVLILVIGAALVVRRRLRRSAPVGGAEDAWALARRRLAELDVDWPDSATPRQVPEIVGDRLRDLWGTSADIEEPLARLADAVQDARYARYPRWVDVADLRRWSDEAVGAAHAARDRQVSGRPAPGDDPSGLPVG